MTYRADELAITLRGAFHALERESLGELDVFAQLLEPDIQLSDTEIQVQTNTGYEAFSGFRFEDVPSTTEDIDFLSHEEGELSAGIRLPAMVWIRQPAVGAWSLVIAGVLDVVNWSRVFSPSEFLDELEKQLTDGVSLTATVQYGDVMQTLDFEVVFAVENPHDEIHSHIQNRVEQVRELAKDALAGLETKKDVRKLGIWFDFPADVRTACEQYLLYFVEFLKDMSVEATAELREVDGRTLFSVAPQDGRDALVRVREALNVYLRLPAASAFELGDRAVDYRIQQLSANIQHLKGQLTLASSALELKQATIEQQQLTILQQRQYLSGSVIAESARVPASADEELLLGGAVALTKYQGSGFTVNVPEIYRRLRALFAKDSEQSK
jgi:hypothetical protein